MPKRGKKYQDAVKQYDKSAQYEIDEAFEILCKIATAKFDETIEILERVVLLIGVAGKLVVLSFRQINEVILDGRFTGFFLFVVVLDLLSTGRKRAASEKKCRT